MKEFKVRISEEYRGNINRERKYHLVDIETGRNLIGNLKKEEVKHYVNIFCLTLVED